MHVVTKRQASEEDIQEWLSTEVGFLEGLTETGGEPTELYDYQRAIVRDPHPFVAGEKARQTGWSFARSLRALAKAYLWPAYTAIFISLNMQESKRKIRYARQAHESMPSSIRLKIVTDNKTELEFSNGSRLVAVHEPRGEGPADVELDELAHYAQDRQNSCYTDSLPIISRGGQLALGSTPLGQSGRFYDVTHRAHGKYKQYKIYRVFWWDCPAMCTDVRRARKLAPKMPTEERVQRFGTTRLQEIFDNFPLEDVQQEYELLYIDEQTSYFPYELILPCTEPPPEIYETFQELARATKGLLYAGYDVGRRRNTSELTVWEKPGEERVYERLFKTYDKTDFAVQQADLEAMFQALGPRLIRLDIDETGIGMMLAENLFKKFGARVEPLSLTSQIKEMLAVNFRAGLEARNVRIYPDQERIAHLHSVKRTVLPSGIFRYDTERNEKHHADKAWSQMLGYFAATEATEIIDLSQVRSVGPLRTGSAPTGGFPGA